MKKILFHRESNDFTDILTDVTLKKHIKTKVHFLGHLIIGFSDNDDADKIIAYAMIKFGDDAIDFHHIIPDRSPIPNKDYVPIRKSRNRTRH
jgi:hypothetical protein